MRWTVWVAVTMALACGRGDASSAEALDGNDSAVTDVIGRPDNREAQTPADSEFKRPERRPVRTVPPLTRPDTTR